MTTKNEAENAAGNEPHCLVELVDHKLIVTMNRPQARNALSGEMLSIMEQRGSAPTPIPRSGSSS